jgi:membrane protease subunit HflC
MKNSFKYLVSIVLLIVLVILYTGLFTVQEGRQALVLRLGKLKTDGNNQAVVYKPGLHFKMPFITTDVVFDTRVQTLDIESSRIVTAEKKDVIVDYYVKWRITDLAKYYTSTGGDVSRAEVLLKQQVNNGLRAQFGQRTIPEVVSDDRSQIMSTLRTNADASATPLGIDVIDVRIKAIDLPSEVSSAVFARMRAERERVASEHRAGGKSAAEVIRAKADADITVLIATARQQAAVERAKGQQKAAKIYAAAYSQNPDFYAFYRSLKAYEDTFNNKHDLIVLGPNSQFFDYMNKSNNK